jgi:porin
MMFGSAAFAESPFSDCLTGDWGGVRTGLNERGVTVDVESTHYYQGPLSGSGSDDFEYAGRLDALVNFDTGKLGLWEGGVLRTHTEYRYGDLSPT